jgi:phosphoribosylanthranilate isomerase
MKNSECLRDACDRAPLVVGVFANQSTSKINEIASIVGLDIVQLHGDEGFEVCAEIDLPTIRVCHLPAVVNTQGVDPEAIFQHIQGGLANFILLDTTIKGQHGGTGVTFDWKIASFFHQSRLPCLMAGGLTAENVAKAILLAVPVGVDVSSGVEIQGSPGLKDHSKVNAFVKAVKYHWTCVSSTIDEE